VDLGSRLGSRKRGVEAEGGDGRRPTARTPGALCGEEPIEPEGSRPALEGRNKSTKGQALALYFRTLEDAQACLAAFDVLFAGTGVRKDVITVNAAGADHSSS
jgi:hypothetical protein